METIHYYPKGTCSVEMFIDHQDGIIQQVKIIRGCGMPLEEAYKRLNGIQCRNGTSCPDQLAQAIKQYLNK